ncbi:MAG: pyruvate kinase [Candidatus Omnitrophica bacterium]|nr:pyruvate kinase [Candidatus Omnitrophota bacterium]MDD5440873.1 pyruvate kinase [Candidatus Omnitrophota bacterium]
MVRTKIIATLGPASNNTRVIRKMMDKGLDIVRLNFSHGTHETHIKAIKLIRTLNAKRRRKIMIMQDLEGFRIRVGKVSAPVKLVHGKPFCFYKKNVLGNEKGISLDYSGLFSSIKKGSLLYIDDGRLIFEVRKSGDRLLETVIVTGGILNSHKGVNMPDVNLKFPSLTEKDKNDLIVALNYKVDYIAQSFVRSAADVNALRKFMESKVSNIEIFAKVENKQAIANIDSIIDAADGIMVARGDLGVCLPIYKVPVLQKAIIKRCNAKNKPVIVATQMMESMITQSMPTRAEVSDVANAILDGASHVLLSAETAVGIKPERVVDMMNKVIKYTEKHIDG